MDKERLTAIQIGETTMLADLTKCLIEELKVMQKPWQSMSQSEQDDVIDRLEKQLTVASQQAINIIASRDMPEVTGEVESVTFKNGAKVVIKFSSITEGVHALADASGHFVKIIIPETDDLINKSEMPEGEADQRGLDLGHEYDESETAEQYEGEPFISTGNEEKEEELADALAEADAESESEKDPDADDDGSIVVSEAESDLEEDDGDGSIDLTQVDDGDDDGDEDGADDVADAALNVD